MVTVTAPLKHCAAGIREWTEGYRDYAVGAFFAKLNGWDRERRFVVIRERIREDKEDVGRQLIELPVYTFRIFVTTRNEDPLERWQDYNKSSDRATHRGDQSRTACRRFLHEGFLRHGTFLAVLFTFNLLSLYQKVSDRESGYRQPATSRAAVFLGGAV